MKEIGEFLKSSRIQNGISLEEAAEDLNFSVIQLENVEDGNVRAFKDVFILRELVKEYAKYLGVETDNIMDEFNDFMFEHTSKISLDDILEARKLTKEKEVEEKEKISSPYTKIRTPKISWNRVKWKPILITIGLIIAILAIIGIWSLVHKEEEVISSELVGRKMEEVYEFTY